MTYDPDSQLLISRTKVSNAINELNTFNLVQAKPQYDVNTPNVHHEILMLSALRADQVKAIDAYLKAYDEYQNLKQKLDK